MAGKALASLPFLQAVTSSHDELYPLLEMQQLSPSLLQSSQMATSWSGLFLAFSSLFLSSWFSFWSSCLSPPPSNSRHTVPFESIYFLREFEDFWALPLFFFFLYLSIVRKTSCRDVWEEKLPQRMVTLPVWKGPEQTWFPDKAFGDMGPVCPEAAAPSLSCTHHSLRAE